MSKHRPFSPPVVVGAVSLITVFAVLCLVVFSLLSLSTAQANMRLSDTSAAAVYDYYRADAKAEQLLACLRAGEVPEGVQDSGNGIYRYGCPISDTQLLAVEVSVAGTEFTILRWQAVSTAEWTADDAIPVWDGKAMQEE